MPGDTIQKDLSLLPPTSTKHSSPKVGMSFKENYTIVPIPSSKAVTHTFYLGGEVGNKQRLSDLFPKKLISIGTECGQFQA